jgi:hypothetical protein
MAVAVADRLVLPKVLILILVDQGYHLQYLVVRLIMVAVVAQEFIQDLVVTLRLAMAVQEVAEMVAMVHTEEELLQLRGFQTLEEAEVALQIMQKKVAQVVPA